MISREVTPAQAEALLAELERKLESERSVRLGRPYARAILEAAVRNAAGRPTAQAPMVAERMRVLRKGDDTIIIGTPSKRTRTGARMGKVAFGAEFGSDRFKQFGPRRTGGSWLHPAADAPDPATRKVAESFLADLLEAVIR